MNLGDKVSFQIHYKKSSSYVNPDQLTEIQETELEETDQIRLLRLDASIMENSIVGIICGKRRMVKYTVFEYANSRFNPEGDPALMIVDSEHIDVYLVAVNMNGFYRVTTDCLEKVEEE